MTTWWKTLVGWVHSAGSFLAALGMAVQTGVAAAVSDFVEPTLRHVGDDRSSGGFGLRHGEGVDEGGTDLGLEVEHLVTALRALEGAHPSFAPPQLEPERSAVEAELASRWPDLPPAWNDPPWSPTQRRSVASRAEDDAT